MTPELKELLNDPANWTDELYEDPEVQKLITKKLSNPWWRLNNLYWIRNEQGELVKFKMRKMQRDFMKGLHGRDILLKARQGGFTTVIDIYFLDRALFNPSVHVGISAHKQKDSENIFREKILTPYENLPQIVRNLVHAEIARAGELEFSNGSLVRVAVSLRGGTYQCVHISEYGPLCAHQPKKAEEVKTGTLNTAHQGSIIVIESTAEGAAGEYYRMVNEARERQDDATPLQWNEWKFHFSAWWQDAKYALVAPKGWKESIEDQEYFDRVEKGQATTITADQRYWYVMKRKEQGAKIKQEFPSTPEEAFLHSGRSVFDRDQLTELKAETYSPVARYKVSPTGAMRQDPSGEICIYQPPNRMMEYVCGADVAEGLVENDSSDSSSADVLDIYGNQVATLHGKPSPAFYAVQLAALCSYYNMALLAVERNNHGHSTLNELSKHIKYKNLYIDERKDTKTNKSTKKLGWGTDMISKTMMIDDLEEAVTNESITIASRNHLNEMQTYVIDAKGSYNSLSGSHDDRVIGLAIAYQMLRRVGERLRSRRNQRHAISATQSNTAASKGGW